MNEKEVGELRRHLRRDRSNMTNIYGCYVNDQKEIISQFSQSLGMMPENESEKYFALLKRTLSGTIGKNLIDISFKTAQVADSPEHKLLMGMRDSRCKDDELRDQLCKKIIDTVTFDGNYLILMAGETYDVPLRARMILSRRIRARRAIPFLSVRFAPSSRPKRICTMWLRRSCSTTEP